MRFLRARPPRIVQRGFLAMGTWVTVTLALHRMRQLEAEAAIDEVEKLMVRFGQDGWAWGPGALAEFNRRLAAGETPEIPSTLQPLFLRAWDLHRRSGGRFEPRIASLVRLWGFDDHTRLRSEPPPAAEIARALADLHAAPPWDGGPAYGPAPGIGWDLGAIGKGWIVERSLDVLGTRGLHGASVDAGGNVAVRGARGDRAWRIGIRDPRSPAATVRLLGKLEARDEAVITHADDQRFFEHGGKRYAHVLDPATGWPVQGLRSLTVVHPDPTLADGGGAAVFVAGLAEGGALARELGIEQMLAVTDDGVLHVTRRLAERLQLGESFTAVAW